MNQAQAIQPAQSSDYTLQNVIILLTVLTDLGSSDGLHQSQEPDLVAGHAYSHNSHIILRSTDV